VSGTPTSILADGAAVFFSFLKLAPAGGWFGFSVCEGSFGRGRNGRAFFLRAGSRVGWEGGSRGGAADFSGLRGRGRGSLAKVGFIRCFYV
jgi:hypothetical protein